MDSIIKFLKDLNDFETAIAIILAIAIPIIGFLLRKNFFKKTPENNSTHNKIEKSEIEGDAILGRDNIKLDKSIHYHHYNKEEKKFSPSIKINKRQQGNYHQLEIYNNGNEALVDLEINIHGSPQRVRFITIDEDQMFATPHYTEVLTENEHKVIIDLPKKVTIKVSAKGAKSQKTMQIEEFFDFRDHVS